MLQRSIRRILTFVAITLVSAAMTRAQSSASTKVFTIPVRNSSNTLPWDLAQQVGSSKKKLVVVTLDQPNRRQTCRIKSFTEDKLVCSRGIGRPRTYLPQQIAAIILPGDQELRLPIWIGANVGLGAAIWGTVVLAATCPVCAVGTGIAAFWFFGVAGAMVFGDGQPDQLLYLASGQELSRKLGNVQPLGSY